jgi:hypothetical protein
MQLLAPIALLGLVAIAVPLVLHWLSRRPAREEEFPSLRFLPAAPTLPARLTRLTDPWVLLSRVAAVIFAAVALAQPFFGARKAAPAATRVVLIDESVHGVTRLRDSLRAFAGDTAVRAVLSRDVIASTAHASAWLAEQPGARRLEIIADLTRVPLDSFDVASAARGATVRVMHRSARRAESAYLAWRVDSRAWVVRPLRAAGGPDTLRVQLTSGATEPTLRGARFAFPREPRWGELLEYLATDTALAIAAERTRVTDSVRAQSLRSVGDSALVLRREPNGAPVLIAAAQRDGDTRPTDARTLHLASVWGENTAEHRAVELALEGWASNAPARSVFSVTAGETFDPASYAAQLSAVGATARAEAPRVSSERRELAAVRPRDAADPATTPSHARWLWLAALAALGAEAVLRRRRDTLA